MQMELPSSPNQLVRNEDEWPSFKFFFTSSRKLVGEVLVLVVMTRLVAMISNATCQF